MNDQNETDEVATHVLIPMTIAQRLKDLARKTRVTQSVYLREALQDLLAKYRPEADEQVYEPMAEEPHVHE